MLYENRNSVLWFLLISVQILVVSPCVGQKNQADIANIEDELDQAEQLIDSEPLLALDILEGYLKRRGRRFNFEHQSRVYHLSGKANFALDQYDLAIKNYLRALDRGSASYQRSKKLAISPPNPMILYDLSVAYRSKEEWSNAARYGQRFITEVEEKNAESRLLGFVNLGYVFLGMGNLEDALTYANRAQDAALSIGNVPLQIEADYLLGSVQERNREYDLALDNLNRAIDLADSIELEDKGQSIAQAIGRTYRSKNDRQNELVFKNKRRERSIERNDLAQQNTLDLEIAEIYIDMEQSQEAVPYLEESVQISEELGDLERNIDARKSLSGVYATTGNYNEALDNYKKYVALVDRLYANKQKEIELTSKIQQDLFGKQETISLLEKDQELRESQIVLLEKDRALQTESLARQRLFIYGLMAFIVVILISAYLLFRNIQKKKMANQLLALKSLRSQMNPHFIFNALNSVNGFISKNDTRQANKYLTDFSRLMRTVMENSQKDFVPLNEEIDVLELYLKLEHFRFKDQFDYELTVDENITSELYRIPPMLVQPYIENAIWHGLRYRETKGQLAVRMTFDADALSLEVQDNGIGRKRSQELKTHNQKAQESTGMKNTEDRIKLLNNTYNSQIVHEIEDIEGEETGTRVSVKIPLELIQERI